MLPTLRLRTFPFWTHAGDLAGVRPAPVVQLHGEPRAAVGALVERASELLYVRGPVVVEDRFEVAAAEQTGDLVAVRAVPVAFVHQRVSLVRGRAARAGGRERVRAGGTISANRTLTRPVGVRPRSSCGS